ncbi:unnamed protein product [Urochloa humidicola]
MRHGVGGAAIQLRRLHGVNGMDPESSAQHAMVSGHEEVVLAAAAAAAHRRGGAAAGPAPAPAPAGSATNGWNFYPPTVGIHRQRRMCRRVACSISSLRPHVIHGNKARASLGVQAAPWTKDRRMGVLQT